MRLSLTGAPSPISTYSSATVVVVKEVTLISISISTGISSPFMLMLMSSSDMSTSLVKVFLSEVPSAGAKETVVLGAVNASASGNAQADIRRAVDRFMSSDSCSRGLRCAISSGARSSRWRMFCGGFAAGPVGAPGGLLINEGRRTSTLARYFSRHESNWKGNPLGASGGRYGASA